MRYCLYLFSFHLLIYCICTTSDFNKWRPKPSHCLDRAPAAQWAPVCLSILQQSSYMCKTKPQQASWCWQGMTQHVNASSGTSFPGYVQPYSSVSFQKAFPGATAAISRRSWCAAWHTWLWYSSTSPGQQKYGTWAGVESAGDICNTIPGKPISADSKAKKWSYLLTPVLRRAWYILHVINILQTRALLPPNTEVWTDKSIYLWKNECINYLKINLIA